MLVLFKIFVLLCNISWGWNFLDIHAVFLIDIGDIIIHCICIIRVEKWIQLLNLIVIVIICFHHET